MLSFNTPISAIPGVGETILNKLAKLGVATIGQAVYYYPFVMMILATAPLLIGP